MKILFVSSVAAGGSGASQRQLARRLAQRGHAVEILAADPSRRVVRRLYDRQVDLSTRLRSSRLRRPLLAAQRTFGTRSRLQDTPDHPTLLAAVPENAFRKQAERFSPDVVVASSIDRVTWRRLRAQLRVRGVPSVLYIREASGLGHLTVSNVAPDLLLANAASHAAAARAAGHECAVVPSVVEVADAAVESTRRVVLLVNPITILGGDRLWNIAAARPDIPFVVQESGLMSADERSAVHAGAARLANVTVRNFVASPAEMLADTRVLLVPHRVDNRPRVVLEAQSNGIPVIASDHPGLVECVGPGGMIVEDTGEPGPWVAALGALWDSPERYASLAHAARTFAARDEVDPASIAAHFEQLVAALVGRASLTSG